MVMSNKHKLERQSKIEYWGRHISAWLSGDKTVNSYCKSHDLIPSQFFYWRKQISLENTRTKGCEESEHFIEVTTEQQTRVSISQLNTERERLLTVNLPSGLSIVIPSSNLANDFPTILSSLRQES